MQKVALAAAAGSGLSKRWHVGRQLLDGPVDRFSAGSDLARRKRELSLFVRLLLQVVEHLRGRGIRTASARTASARTASCR